MATIISYDLPNWKDENQWKAGGTLYQEKFAGGYIFNPTDIVSADQKPNLGIDYNMVNGKFKNELNNSFVQVEKDVKGGEYFDLFSDTEVNEIYNFSITVTATDGTISTIETDINGDRDAMNNLAQMNTISNIQDIANMMNTKGIDLTSSTLQIALISWSISSIMSGKIFTSPSMTISNFLGASLIGSVKSMVTGQLSSAIASALNVTNMYAGALLGISVSAVVGELMEMALGLDKSFGVGGEYNKSASEAFGQVAFGESIGFMGVSTLSKSLSYTLGLTDELNLSYTDSMGNVIGQSVTTEGYNGADYTGYGTSYYDSYYGALEKSWNEFNFDYMGDDTSGVDTDKMEMEKEIDQEIDEWGGDTGDTTNDDGLGLGGISDIGGDGSGNHGTSSGVGGGGNTSGSTSGGGTYSCFIAGTKVLAYVNSNAIEVNIEDVKLGDVLIGENNSLNTVLEYDSPKTNGRPIYGFNGKKPFVTSEHMFKTVKGWKAIKNEDAKIYHKKTFTELDMDIDDNLATGDVVVSYSKNLEIKSIEKQEVDFNTQVYNFKLNGNNTYYANRLLVHNK